MWQMAMYLQPSGEGWVGNCPSEARKGREKGSMGEGEEERQKRGVKTTYNHRDSKVMVIL